MTKVQQLENMLINYKSDVAKLKNINNKMDHLNVDKKELDRLSIIKSDLEVQIKNINNSLMALPERERKLIELRYFDKLTFGQISIRLNVSYDYCRELRTETLKKLVSMILF